MDLLLEFSLSFLDYINFMSWVEFLSRFVCLKSTRFWSVGPNTLAVLTDYSSSMAKSVLMAYSQHDFNGTVAWKRHERW